MQRPNRFAKSFQQPLDAWLRRLGIRSPKQLARKTCPRFLPALEALERVELLNTLAQFYAPVHGRAVGRR